MIELGQPIFNDSDAGSSLEWLETNGHGGYASGTVSGAHTRRYHGLLVAATKPPLGRMVLLSKFEETVIVDGERYDLSTNRYQGAVHPEGYKLLTAFRLDPFPVWTFNAGGVEIEKKIFMVHGENTIVVSWSANKKAVIELRPLLAFRDHHHLRLADDNFDCGLDAGAGYISVKPVADAPALFFAHNAVSVSRSGDWYRNFEYEIERERGFDHSEDLYQPCVLSFDLAKPAAVVASTEKRQVADIKTLEQTELERRRALMTTAKAPDEFSKRLVLAADQFIVGRGSGHTVIAGYHWFSDWGRDTMIALPGLTLATNRPEIAKSIINEFADHISEGMLPNRFPDEGKQPEYNTVDATLWYFEAIRAYAERTGDFAYVRKALYGKLVDIIDWHIRGTRYGIGVDTDGLLRAGEPDVQLTWMDAKIGDRVITPRTGKPVEIQALWYNALCIMRDLAEESDDEKRYGEMAAAARASFNGQFWNNDENCLYDVVENGIKDASVRPNQLFAVSLPHTMLDAERAHAVVKKCEAELLTPVGLRSLSPRDPRYVPVYEGSPEQRDSAYHQGTVWTWLIGPFIDAYRRTHADDPKAAARIGEIIAGFRTHLADAALGQVGEIFDGDPPHKPRGAAAQAWSVAELLRVMSAGS